MIPEYHAHLYFTPETRASALRLREELLAMKDLGLDFGRVYDEPTGPHTAPMFRVTIPNAAFAELMSWLIRKHGDHPVLVHPLMGDDLFEHTQGALWLGNALPLDLSRL